MMIPSKSSILIALKGMAMGAADIIPGVSGGTIALITGIYEQLINSLKSFTGLPTVLFKEGIVAAWKHINGNFLIALFIGIIISFLSLVHFIKYALAEHPILLWSFFFGLIIASCYYVGKRVNQWGVGSVLGLVFGTILVYFLTTITPAETSTAPWFIFISGMIAICAMILPGISGAFILVLLGKYKFIIESLSELRLEVVIIFALGCGVGLLSFSHFLSFMLRRFHNFTIALLTGFMIGSLNKIWPWKNTLEWGTGRHGDQIAVVQENVWPQDLSGESFLGWAITMAIIGLLTIVALEKLAAQKSID